MNMTTASATKRRSTNGARQGRGMIHRKLFLYCYQQPGDMLLLLLLLMMMMMNDDDDNDVLLLNSTVSVLSIFYSCGLSSFCIADSRGKVIAKCVESNIKSAQINIHETIAG